MLMKAKKLENSKENFLQKSHKILTRCSEISSKMNKPCGSDTPGFLIDVC
jgi:hypothetical protein